MPATIVRARGFTLIEMLVVLGVIGMLLSIVAPRYLAHVDHARDLALKQDLRTMRDAIDKFTADRARDPADLAELVSTGYLREVPADPLTDSATSWQPVVVDGKMHDVRSGASGNGEDGTPYASW
jgi:general secretion pathway protein G